jgi:tRNA (guanine9-N1)-methyltransferase
LLFSPKVIGGIVDHNRLKGLTYRTATASGIKTVRLPIVETLGVRPSNSLTLNQVFQILSMYARTKDWKQALDESVPNRQGRFGVGFSVMQC